MTIFYIGGSPCSGKSTVAEALAAQYGLSYFKADDYLAEFTDRGAAAGLPVCQHILRISPDENWMRPPVIQCQEELDYYMEIAPFVAEKLRHFRQPVIAEGATFLPCLMQATGVPADQYIAIIPSRKFQISRYRQRPWVPQVLQGCADPETAFANWMERDALFAQDVQQQCQQLNYTCLLTDGSIAQEARLEQVASHFRLDSRICQEHA